ncbi:MAG: Crp/Fnr family transcriptional regulator, partial [Chloroflexota bacterium]
PKSIFGELAILDGKPHATSAQAMEDSNIYTMSQSHFKHHLECIPQLSSNLIQQMSYKMRKTTGHINTLASKPVIARLAVLISKLAEEYGIQENNQTTIKFNLNQTQIATMIGATKESTNRALMQLSQFKVLRKEESRIHVLDMQTLHSLSG